MASCDNINYSVSYFSMNSEKLTRKRKNSDSDPIDCYLKQPVMDWCFYCGWVKKPTPGNPSCSMYVKEESGNSEPISKETKDTKDQKT